MEKEQRTRLQKATQDARKLLEEEFSSQLLQTYDIDVDKVRWADKPGAHLLAEQRLIREKLIAWIEHKEAQINDRKEALLLALREMAFTALNRFVALKLMEARELVRPCVSGGLESAGFLEFTAVAQGLLADQESSYRLYLETIFEDVSRELRALFDPRDPASLLWPKRAALLELLEILNRPELAELWGEDETLGWVYQYFNGDAERKKMREESAAPRNSRELAVRNQFFTPRYVVEFLTDNTLGRIWYEMRQGDTGLKERCRYLVRRPNEIWLHPGDEAPAEVVADEALSQEELLRQPVHIPDRPLKDPREIRMLDPACGSMHFGLYAFDLYLAIYAEAWEIAQSSDEQAKQAEAFASFVQYAGGIADKAAFLREVPRLILLHNIHGIDIDPRATQIARLTLWLRAQRAWQEQQLEAADRLPISRSNVVCAEPMPGERELLAEFVDQQFPEVERGLVQQLLKTIFDKMQLAGEAGSLLKIEDEIRDAIDQARREWKKLAVQQQDLFSPAELAALGQVGPLLETDLQNLTKDFWINIEERIYAALRDYAMKAESASGFQRRLFAEDAAQGFAFIDVCRKRYDVALMNPPFGEPPSEVLGYVAQNIAEGKNDIYASMVMRASSMLELSCGLLGAITSRAFVVGRDLRAYRRQLLAPGKPCLSLFLDLGGGVLDGAMVETAAYILAGRHSGKLFYKDLRKLRHSDSEPISGRQTPWAERPLAVFEKSKDHQLLFELTDNLIIGMRDHDSFSPEFAEATQGLTTEDDQRFVRLRWEVPIEDNQKRWFILSKGGEYSWFTSDLHLVVNRFREGAELASYAELNSGNIARTRQSSKFYGFPAASYSRRSQKGFSCRRLRRMSVFSDKSGVIFPKDEVWLPALPVLMASERYLRLINAQAKFGSYEVGAIKQLPRPSGEWISLVEDAIRIYSKIDTIEQAIETSSLYRGIAINSISFRSAWGEAIDLASSALNSIGLRLSEEVVRFQKSIAEGLDSEWGGPQAQISSAFGVAFGRWDIRLTKGEQAAPELLDPYAPLPVCPPGLLQSAQGLPARPEDVPAAYPIRIPWDGILLDDPNHPLDIERRVLEVIEIIWSGQEGGPTAEAIEHKACEILGVKSLRDYFRKPAGFFADHLKRYSKSRRQAPIYWPISAGSGSYSAWLYYHRLTQDTLYRVLRDFVEPRIQQAEREEFELESQGSLSGDAATRLQEAQSLLLDLRLFKSELDLVAPLWNPNLNDGVIINHAILWRITPFTPWQKKCKECWDKLVNGDYDWAHLAFHLWPERVIRNCITDRSLAIAHGLEARLWQETNKGNWLQRQVSETELQALIAEHSNPAVKSALERFLAAPPPVAPTRTRASRSTRASGSSAPRRPRGTAAVVDAEATRQVLLALTAAPSDGLGKAAIADLIGVEANALTAVIKQLKDSGQIDQLGERRGARYVLSEQGRARLDQEEAP
jgi:hypothetical protein